MLFVSESQLHGGLAQLGERLNGIQEVRGSSPLSSIGRLSEKSLPQTFAIHSNQLRFFMRRFFDRVDPRLRRKAEASEVRS